MAGDDVLQKSESDHRLVMTARHILAGGLSDGLMISEGSDDRMTNMDFTPLLVFRTTLSVLVKYDGWYGFKRKTITFLVRGNKLK